ncbi:MAG TPA: hypothetical protein ENK66_01570, partial [Arcobacter sp.]|nr:hypothetical protein [Arcobacter sp.]
MRDKKIFNTMAIVATVVFLAVLINLTLSFRDFGLDSAKEKAQVVAQSVKNGLTAHMVNGIMANRQFFFSETKKLKNIDDIWIVRAQAVIDQYGNGFEKPKDAIDKKVLETGIMVEQVNESMIGKTTYRITIPYIAETNNQINCLDCHKTEIGKTLGAITMVMNVDDVKEKSLQSVGLVTLIVILLIIPMFIMFKRIVNPYFTIFDSIKKVMKKANKGDFSGRIENIKSGEAKDVSHWINTHMERLQTSLYTIEKQIDVFLTAHKQELVIDPIEDVEQTVQRLAEIYKFRKTIERDEKIEDVYKRFAVILEDKFSISNFNFLEADTTNKKIEVVYINKELLCDPFSDGCRADRTNV